MCLRALIKLLIELTCVCSVHQNMLSVMSKTVLEIWREYALIFDHPHMCVCLFYCGNNYMYRAINFDSLNFGS